MLSFLFSIIFLILSLCIKVATPLLTKALVLAQSKLKGAIASKKKGDSKSKGNIVTTKLKSIAGSFKSPKKKLVKASMLALKAFINGLVSLLRGLSVLLSLFGILEVVLIFGLVVVIVCCFIVPCINNSGATPLRPNSGHIAQVGTPTGGTTPLIAPEGMEAKIETLAQWYLDHVCTYSGGHLDTSLSSYKYYQKISGDSTKFKVDDQNWYYCELLRDKKAGSSAGFVRDDCTGFAMAFVSYVTGKDIKGSIGSSAIVKEWKEAEALGWEYIDMKDIKSLGDIVCGDILVSNAGASKSGLTGGKGHAEIVVSGGKNNTTFGWGWIKTKYPSASKNLTYNKSSGLIVDNSGHKYNCLYRYKGGSGDEKKE